MTLDPLAASVILAWAAIVILAFALAGVLRQLHILQHQGSFPVEVPMASSLGKDLSHRQTDWLDENRMTALIFTTGDCMTCRSVLDAADLIAESVSQLVALHVVPLDGWAPSRSDGVKVLEDALWLKDFFAVVATPHVALLDPEGRVRLSEPVGSADQFESLIGKAVSLAASTRQA